MDTHNTDLKEISIRLASPQEILSWSHGEVIKPETLNYRTQRPEKDGLFSERIFGPTKDYECYCGKYKKVRYKGIVCEKCGVEVTRSIVRRERMGHISLATPVAHIWFLRTVPSRVSILLDISVPKLEKVIYYAAYIVTAVNEESRKRALETLKREVKGQKEETKGKDLEKIVDQAVRLREILEGLGVGMIITEEEYFQLAERFGDVFEADRGAGAIRRILEGINLAKLEKEVEKELGETGDENRTKKLYRRLKLVRSLMKSNIRPEWMILTELPILPPDLRPMVALDGGRYATADLNDLYRRVINRNNRLKRLIELRSPEVIVTNERRMLQEAVDALIDNSSRAGGQLLSTRRRPLRSLADMLKGKQGRFRQNLLGKRVDYSGRSVIVVGPELKLNECGLPKNLALELFRHFVINKIIERGFAHNIKQANRFIEQGSPEVWEILEEVIKNRKVLLNRAPTLHRLGIQAFKPLLIEDLAIRIPPLVCSAFNADFDGDQMAVHLPLTAEAQYEATKLMDAASNLLKPANGDPIVSPSQDVVLGCYFLTKIKEEAKGEGKTFSDLNEATYAFDQGLIDIHALIKVRYRGELTETTYGRLVLNELFPEDFGLINEHMGKKSLSKLIARIIDQYGIENGHVYLDRIKNLGFEYATMSAITWGMRDTVTPKEKFEIIKEGEERVAGLEDQFESGLLTEKERRSKIIEVWNEVRDKVYKAIPKALEGDGKNPVFAIVDSGSRGSWSQPHQMMGMKGLVANPQGETIELPIKSSYKEGLRVLEYFIATHGARKGSTDTALKTASAGYLTRRLVDVSQDIVVREENCKTKKGITIHRADGQEYGYAFADRLHSRTSLEDIVIDKKTLVKAGQIISEEAAKEIQDSSVESVVVRSPIACETINGICSQCYGLDLSKGKLVETGEAVGIVAAQSIGEPGTQLTMRTFHIGGIAGIDITHGLPRVEEIFEARPPKGKATLVQTDGIVESVEDRGLVKAVLVKRIGEKAAKPKRKTKKAVATGIDEYLIPAGMRILAKEGDKLEKGAMLSEGHMDLRELMEFKGPEEVERYIINEVQKIYVPEGASISDKHIEVIAKRMLSRMVVTDPGDSNLIMGDLIDRLELAQMNQELKKEKKQPAKGKLKIMGITRVALDSPSFLSSSSFQETSRVLVSAAVEGKKDFLRGLKENVIIGKLIPAGTGLYDIPEEELTPWRAELEEETEGFGGNNGGKTSEIQESES